MTWLEQPRGYQDPLYYADAASDTEQHLRADFAKHYALREIAPYGETPSDVARLENSAVELAAPWVHHGMPQWRALWGQIDAATDEWETDPEAARRYFDGIARSRQAGDRSVDDMSWRTLRQAREITGHTDGTAYGSSQDQASWRAPGPQLRLITNTTAPQAHSAPDTAAASAQGTGPVLSAVDRALGARPGAQLLSMDEVGAVIDGIDLALDWEEELGDRNGTDQLARQAALLCEVQDLTAEHSRVADGQGEPIGDSQALVEHMESLLAQLRRARAEALAGGVEQSAIDLAYRAGLDGTYWSDRPAHPHLGRIAQLTAERDDARAETAALRAVVADLRDQLARRAAAPTSTETAAAPTLSTPAIVNPTIGADTTGDGGAAIGAAIDAAIPDDAGNDWDTATEPAEPVLDSPRAEVIEEAVR
ncbi:hypothetical protein [Nocardia pseudovaccinii]|uniref:hypothetical protein n=1 Tax=Nocardia pseudovaccinii TaxID=189540 RepID=UPI000A4EE421|nr:hypothetical protein [Nocardia pseudovaccinii]